MTALAGRLKLNVDVLLVPVAELSEESRRQIECNDGDIAVSRLRSRSGSTVVDSAAAELLDCFREPRSVVEAAILFGRRRQQDPDEVLQGAFDLLRKLRDQGVLIGAEGTVSPEPQASKWQPGERVLKGTVVRTLQVLDDSEVYLLVGASGQRSVLKIERVQEGVGRPEAIRSRLRREAAVLDIIDGDCAPKLVQSGDIDGLVYLEMTYCPGAEVTTAAHEWREAGNGRGQLLELIQGVAGAYARLHDRGVIHGDVHTRNVLVDASGHVWLIDFGLASGPGPDLAHCPDRGGIPFFYEPELAQAYLSGALAPPATAAGEQFALAAVLYFLVTGAHWQDFRLGREQMLCDIAEKRPLSFSDRGVAPWPELEAVLQRALARDPADRYDSMPAFARALAAVPSPRTKDSFNVRAGTLERAIKDAVEATRLDGPLLNAQQVPPTASVTYGAAGIALGLLHIANARDDAGLLATADVWARRALRNGHEPSAFYNPDIEITPEMVGEASPYHTASGVHAVTALLAHARGDRMAQEDGLAGFLEATDRPVAGLDLTLGKASLLVGSAILLDGLEVSGADALRARGDDIVTELWVALDQKRPIAEGDIDYLGIAHGWAGLVYAALQWCDAAKIEIPPGLPRRLSELAALAQPAGRGLEWPWVLRASGEQPKMVGWCNGSAGYVFLWTLAHRLLREPRLLDLAIGAGWNTWEAADTAGTLCCGLVGRSYALLNLYRHTGDSVWLRRASDLAYKAAKDQRMPSEYPHSLYKGAFGLAVLAADLEHPEHARMPLFESYDLRAARPAG